MKWLTRVLAAPAVRQAALALLAALAGAMLGPQLDAQLRVGPYGDPLPVPSVSSWSRQTPM